MNEFLEQGEHVLCDMWNVDAKLLDDEDFLRELLTTACQLSGATVLSVQSKYSKNIANCSTYSKIELSLKDSEHFYPIAIL